MGKFKNKTSALHLCGDSENKIVNKKYAALIRKRNSETPQVGVLTDELFATQDLCDELNLSSTSNFDEQQAFHCDYSTEYKTDHCPQSEHIKVNNTDILSVYLNSISKYKLLTADEEKIYISIAQNENIDPRLRRQARDHMLNCNLRLVVHCVQKKINHGGVDILDLIEEGNLGLLRAIEKFDVSRNFRFGTYAYWWIKQAIDRAILANSRTVYVPAYLLQELSLYIKKAFTLTQKLLRQPTCLEIAEHMGKSVERISDVLQLNQRNLSTDSPIPQENPNETQTISEMFPDFQNKNPHQELEAKRLKKSIEECLMLLSHKHRTVLSKRFGLLGESPEQQLDIGNFLGISRQGAQQLQVKAMEKLKKIFKLKNITMDLLKD
jgi:RNA polymerase sigma factor (sigma-70 family)